MKPRTLITRRGDGRGAASLFDDCFQDCAFLVLVAAFSFAPYLAGLSFSSDQWFFLGLLSTSEDQSLAGLFRALYTPNSWPRPGEILYLATLYAVFDARPLGYHLVNSAMLATMALLFSLALRELGQPRLFACAVPLVYVLLPHYSTDRFWSLASALSMALYFASLYADLRGARSRPGRRVAWRLASGVALIGSALTYEVALPLFLLNPLLVWWRGRRLQGARPRLLPLLVATLLLLAPVAAFKAATTSRVGSEGLVRRTAWIVRVALDPAYGEGDAGLNVKQALAVNYGAYGVGLPGVVRTILREYPDPARLALAGLLGVLVSGYVYRLGADSRALDDHRPALRLMVGGFVAFWLGYAIFLTNTNVQFTLTGIANRTAIAAAAGVATSFVGTLAWASWLVRRDALRRAAFAALVGLLCASGFLINATIGSFWVAAARESAAILAGIRRELPSLPPGAAVILDGTCPYLGPAIVFESSWDLAGALQWLYRDPTLRADVVTPRTVVRDDAIVTRLYEDEYEYPFDRLIVYHAGRQAAMPLPNAAAARRYFGASDSSINDGCPRGREGYGVPILRGA